MTSWAALAVSVLAVCAPATIDSPGAPPADVAPSAVGALPVSRPSLCADCTPAPFPCPPCFACIQTDPEGLPERPTPECPLPRSSAA